MTLQREFSDRDERIPNKIKQILRARKRLGLYPSSFVSVAHEADLAKNTVVNLANGEYFPKLDTAYKIARTLNLTVYDVWPEEDVREFLNKLTDDQFESLLRSMEEEDEG
jgi:DNA-binding XRE family transcriptional regulator